MTMSGYMRVNRQKSVKARMDLKKFLDDSKIPTVRLQLTGSGGSSEGECSNTTTNIDGRPVDGRPIADCADFASGTYGTPVGSTSI